MLDLKPLLWPSLTTLIAADELQETDLSGDKAASNLIGFRNKNKKKQFNKKSEYEVFMG